MMRYRIVAEARSWIGTPFHHQQCVKGHGVDCIQLVAGVGSALGLCERIHASKSTYRRLPSPRTLLAGLESALVRVTELLPGDVVAIEWRAGLPTHVGIFTEEDTIIHSMESMGGVIETRTEYLSIHSFWRFGALIDG